MTAPMAVDPLDGRAFAERTMPAPGLDGIFVRFERHEELHALLEGLKRTYAWRRCAAGRPARPGPVPRHAACGPHRGFRPASPIPAVRV